MPIHSKEQPWSELDPFDQEDLSRERNGDSSVSAQYEDHVLPDLAWRYENES